jgi:hypothetical protein
VPRSLLSYALVMPELLRLRAYTTGGVEARQADLLCAIRLLVLASVPSAGRQRQRGAVTCNSRV